MFIFTTCQTGAEAVLKREIAREFPEWKFSFSRPGFLTWKAPDTDHGQLWGLPLVFARHWGVSLGQSTEAELLTKLTGLIAEVGRPAAIQGFSRSPETEVPAPSQELLTSLRQALGVAGSGELKPEDLVMDVILMDEGKYWVGYHRHERGRLARPGGYFDLPLPEWAPSRAYLKVAEAAERWSIPFERGDRAIEIGSAPGGACAYLLERGLDVIGVDPGAMAESLFEARDGWGKFTHVRKSVSGLGDEDFGPEIQWLLVDVNASPDIVLPMIRPLKRYIEPSLKGVLVTIKLNDLELADHLPLYAKSLMSWRLEGVEIRQLSQNRQEVAAFGLMPSHERSSRRPHRRDERRR